MQLLSSSEEQTRRWGERFAEILSLRNQPVFVHLKGTLGAGKSTFARGFIQQWTALHENQRASEIISPTYNLVRLYGEKKPIAHFDLYRIKSLVELEQLGFEQYFYETPACLIEWLELIPEAANLLPPTAFTIEFEITGNDGSERQLILSEAAFSKNEICKLLP